MAKRMLLVAVMVVGAAFSASATAVNDPWTTPVELNVYKIYDLLYGINYGSSNAIPQLAFPLDELFNGTDTFTAQYRYAGTVATEFGYTTPSTVTPLNPLFTVNTVGVLAGPTAVLPGTSFNQYGLYIHNTSAFAHIPNYTWYSESALNSDGLDHLVVFLAPPDSQGRERYLLCWEDNIASRSDRDYNDLVIELTRNVVPEPTSLMLLGMGVAGMAVKRLRRTFS